MRLLDEKKLTENIDGVAEYDFNQSKVFGCAYAVYQDGRLLQRFYGTQALNSTEPITERTVFRIASMSKPITAVATLILVERGLLSLDDTVDRFLPEFKHIKITDTPQGDILPRQVPTVRHILTHTSGICNDKQKLQKITPQENRTLDTAMRFYLRSGLSFEPGTRQMYNGIAAFSVLSKIIEVVSGKDYATFLREEIFNPCGMVDTGFNPSAEQMGRMVQMHCLTDGKSTAYSMPQGYVSESIPSTHYAGGGGLASTLRDYCAFAKMLLNRGRTDSAEILSEGIFSQLCTPQVSAEVMPGLKRWGLGVRVITDEAYPYLPVGSFGWSGAYGSHFWIDPANKIFAVYMKNSKTDGGSGNESAVNFERAVYSSF